MSEGANEDRGGPPSGVGAQLAAERQRQKLELSEVAARTRIPLRHLQAIERGEHDGLPAMTYSVGFVKSYATMLGLDGQALSRAFREQMGQERRAHFEPEAYEPVDPSRVPSRLLAMIALGVALLLGMGYLLLRFESDSSDLAKLAADTPQENRPVAAKRPRPPSVAPSPQPAIPTGPISIVADEDAWLKISERDGSQTYFLDVLKAGQSFSLPETAVDPILRTGRPQSIKLLIGATPLPPVAKPDTLVRDYSLKRDALLAIIAAQSAQPAAPAAVPGEAGNAADPQAGPPRPVVESGAPPAA